MKFIEAKKSEEKTPEGVTIHFDGFDQLIEARNNGQFAVWEFGDFVSTTDDIPENYSQLEYSELVRQMKVKAFERQEKLEKAVSDSKSNTGIKM